MNRKVTGLGGAVGLATVGTLVLVGYVQAAEDRALAGERLVPVLVVDEAVERGTGAADLAGAVRTELVPAKVRAAGAVDDLGDLEGLVATVDLLPGEQLLATRFGKPDVVGPAGLPEGLEEVSIALESERAVGGRITSGSIVAVFASFDGDGTNPPRTEVLLRDAPVVGVAATDKEVDDEGNPVPGGEVLVTLAVEPAIADRIVYGAEHGRIWLSGADGGSGAEVAS